ncbi:MAG TPA: Rrf2 family transcriptional regulator [Atribacter sp.]|jgi:Rrf2 family protein|uniref:HTH-type transcriptional regulator CymR n=1 Tax=Candidatus Atribacter allofermentans TaxID=1852833 RepID=A0A1V5T313_9BACT|nr:Rrf2 family transcriptional regulator [Atribacter sp.]MDD3713780.1 Rrf2 family transcriptional regulator [Atribacterota bacterium]OQA60622.1 MAG: HTH-type transcriptional regulator CymR [Candidatus Atribacteria bacterium ADurb.Bin276]HHT09353.1 Rrf2 family transcriptional regulator [Candidatus Atribacteria bacterium]MDI9595007.1 Rrf2 family transcriptional regulator [Atribacterota bacterium]HOT05011.1 Rrf2 family transcriptional regulator [Atribacter sp.]
MKISTRARYGLRLLVDLAEHSGKDPVKLKDISQRQGISLNYLRQLIMPLESNKIVRSIRGNRGGYLLGKKPEEINLLDIMNLLEGPIDLVDCVHNKNLCQISDTCPTRKIWVEISEKMEQSLVQKSLKDLMENNEIHN